MDKEQPLRVHARYNVLFCIEIYSENAGATVALREYIECNPEIAQAIIVTNHIVACGNHKFKVLEINAGNVGSLFNTYDFDYIHYYHANGDSAFREIISYVERTSKSIPVITTVCQKPSYPGYWLSPYEIKKSNILVYIDYTASKDKMYNSIDDNKVVVIYIGCSDNLIEKTDRINKAKLRIEKKSYVTYGRGSYLQKCPKSMFNVFDKIRTPKEFVVVGGGMDYHKEWVREEIKRRKDYKIKYIEGIPFDDWLKITKDFDVFLYHLPNDAWSSVDGTMVQAMLLEKPVIYCGPSAPKEILEHGYNALIANDESEIPDLCDKLYNDPKLLHDISVNARKTIEEKFRMSLSCDKYNEIALDLRRGKYKEKIHVPLLFEINYITAKFVFTVNNYFSIIKSKLIK